MGDLQLYVMTNLALGEYRTFKQRSLNLLSISAAYLSLRISGGSWANAVGRGISDNRRFVESKQRAEAEIWEFGNPT